MECHAVLFHVPFAKQGELVVVFLLAFALHGLPDSHHLCHQKLHHRCFVQNLEHYLVRSMKRSQPTRHFRLHLLIQTIQLRFRTFPRCLIKNLLRAQNHSRSFLELPVSSIQERRGDSFSISVSLTQLQQKSLCSRFRRQNEQQYRSPRLPPFCSASICEGRVALSVGHPRRTHSRYTIGCCLIPLGICGLKHNLRLITCGIGCVWGIASLSPLSSLG